MGELPLLLFNIDGSDQSGSKGSRLRLFWKTLSFSLSNVGRVELKTILMGLGGLCTAALFLWFAQTELYHARLRDLSLTEREAVLSLCSRMMSDWPKDDDALSDFLGQFRRGQLEAYSDDYALSPSIEVDGDRLIFSTRFFSADAATQAQLFAQFLDADEEPLPDLPPLDEIASRHD